MPITIQEIIASDTISQLVDKTNFNFDQLLLNGGGPAGPAGPLGPVGPAGGRGAKGTRWYEDTSTTAPGVSPNVTPPTSTPLEGDYYLQFNGQVWEYNGTTWVITTIDLQGPQGAQGAGGGFALEFGGPIQISKQTARYNGPIGLGNGATTSNEGVPSIMIGGVVSNTTALSLAIPLTTSYIIPDDIATTLISTDTSLLVHQKDASARAIVFHGGYTSGNPQKFEQTSIAQLSSVSISNDDRLVLSAPKTATTASSLNDVIGFEVNVPKRSQQYTAGKAISFQTGIENIPAFGGENSDFLINVGTGSNAAGNKFVLTTSGTANATLFQAGGGFPVNTSQNAQNGVIQLQSGLIQLTSSVNENIQLSSGGQLRLDTTQGTSPSGEISLKSASGGILLTAAGGAITIDATGTGTSNVFGASGLNLNGERVIIGEDLNSTGTKGIRLGTTDTNNVEGIKLLSGKPAASAIPTGDGIILKTFGIGEDIKIVAENPSITGGITISSGPGVGNTGYVTIASHGANINTNSDGATTIMSVSSQPLIRLQSGSGEIVLGGVTNGQLSGEVSLYKPMVIMAPNESSTWTPGASVQLPRIQVGHKPAVPANTAGLVPFYGGAEIRGPYGSSYSAMGSNPSIVERQGALHIKSGTNTDGRNPGAVYVYTGENTGGSVGGSYTVNSVRLWASAKSMPYPQSPTGNPPSGNRGVTGLTMGLNQNMESVSTGGGIVPSPGTANITNGANVEGRILLYGTRNNSTRQTNDIVSIGNTISPDTVLDQNTPYPHANGVYNYGGVNIGDQYRGRQQFKVFGDIIGDYYTSEFGGSYSGPSIEAQAIFSGGQTWSNKVLNAGTNNGDEDLAFDYKYQWQRVGRVVTGSGFVRLYVGADGSASSGQPIANGGMFTPALSIFNSQMKIGPIPLPMQVNYDGGNSQDGGTTTSTSLRGAQAANISGTVVSKFDFLNSSTNALAQSRRIGGQTISGLSYNGPFPTGDVRGGTSTSDSGANPSTTLESTHLWLSVLSNFSNSYVVSSTTYHGMYAPVMAFTFTYELNAT